MKTILCYGDSNTYGYNPSNNGRYQKKDRWVSILQEKLGKDYEVIPEGLNGRTTAYDRPDGAYQNGLPYLQACLRTHHPLDYVVFMLGTNDCANFMNLTSKDIQLGMEKLINVTIDEVKLMQENECKIVVVVPAAISDNYKNSFFAFQLDEDSYKKSRELVKLYKDLCDKYDCLYLDCSDLQVEESDGEHLTLESHKQLANRLYNMIAYK